MATAPAVGVRRRRGLGLVGAVVLLLLSCIASLAIGTEPVSPVTVWNAVINYSDAGEEWIVHDLRIPRTVLAVVVGLALGLSGAVIQSVANNPLADTGVLGINAGASLFVVVAIAFLGLTDVWAYIWFAFAGALVTMVAVALIGMVGRSAAAPVRLLLAGVALGATMDGISFTIQLRNPRSFDSMRFWSTGALDERDLSVAVSVAPFVGLGCVLCLVMARSLNTIALGDELATTLGGRIARTRAFALLAVTLLAGAAAAAAGPIGFVGLMVPHAVRRITGPDWRWILAYTAVVAPTLLLLADVVGRVVVAPAELPAGIVTAFLGAPVLILLIRRTSVGRG